MNPPDAIALYNAGMGNLQICIEARLEKAGARMVQGSVLHPGWPAEGSPPAYLIVSVVLSGGQIIEAVFSEGEIAAAHKGVTCAGTLLKVDLIVEKYLAFRDRAAAEVWGTAQPRPGLVL